VAPCTCCAPTFPPPGAPLTPPRIHTPLSKPHAAAAEQDPVLFSDYYAVVKKPVCLADMQRDITAGRYTLADMQRDIRRMIANAKKYNKPEAVVYQDSLELERVTRRLVKEIERDGPEDEDEDTL
jgi:hypothetical protein